MIKPKSLGTHSGSFHADEVSACSLLLLYGLIDRDKIVRTRDQKKLDECEFVCDVGGVYDPSIKRFDHHQITYQGSFSSAGMVLYYLKNTKIISESYYEFLNRMIVSGIDAHDNGIIKPEAGICSFSQVVSNFMTVDYSATAKEQDEAFFKALDFVYGHFKRLKKRYEYVASCREKVKMAMMKNSGFLLFEEAIPWLENFFELDGEHHPALYVIMPSGNHWKLRGIPPSLKDKMRVRMPMPDRWAGLDGEELIKVTNIEGAIFCHKGKFISIWKTKEDAMEAMHLILKEKK